jgi:hypothetical protein
MALNLLDNQHIKLTEKTDFFGHLKKAAAIKEFLRINIDSLDSNKMFALFGEWGSGKSTMMHYIEQTLGEDKYLPIFFEAWQHEKDDNLALSLMHVIADHLKNEPVLTKDLVLSAVKCLGKGVRLPHFDMGAMIKGFENEYQEMYSELSSHLKAQQFKEKFKEVEDKILTQENKKRIIVFIDDLDRCEPEHVLSLLSAIKMFFTYGDRIIFFFGVDKDSISRAVKVRYGDVIESEVYLEKIFDITFNMPKEFYFNRLLEHYFPQSHVINNSIGKPSYFLEYFFKQIDFTNQRHLKKVLNKYSIIQSFNINNTTGSSGNHLIPAILHQDSTIFQREEYLINTIFVLYFIILHEFHHEKFNELENYEEKILNYSKSFRDGHNSRYNSNTATVIDQPISILQTRTNVYIEGLKTQNLNELAKAVNNIIVSGEDYGYKKMLTIFTPFNIEDYNYTGISKDYLKQFERSKDKILVNFCNFLLDNQALFKKMEGGYKFWNLFEMAKTLL